MSNYDDNSSIGIYLFVFMILLGVFCFNVSGDSGTMAPLRRDLAQLYV